MAVGLAATFLIGAQPASAACEWPVAKAKAAKRVVPGRPAPLAIGDSTMIFSVPHLAARGFDANARVCRGWNEGLELVKQRKRAGRLPDVVVMALGANSPVRPIDVQRALALLGPKRILGLATHRTWFGKPGPDTQTIRRLARRYRGQVRLLDWVAFSRPHTSWFINDGLHTTRTGARKFADFLAGALG